MRVGASRPRQTSQGDDKDKNTNSDERTGDNAATGGRDDETGNNSQRNVDNDDDEEQESG